MLFIGILLADATSLHRPKKTSFSRKATKNYVMRGGFKMPSV